MISFISSFEVISVVMSDPNIFLWLAASVADATVVNTNVTKTILASGWSFLLKASQFLIMVLKVYPKILLIVLFYGIEFLIILY